MKTILAILVVLVFLLYAKWIFCVLYYPLMAMGAVGQNASNRKLAYVLRFPMRVVEHFLRFGGGRFVLFQIGMIPSVHLRTWLYRGLGVKMGKNVTIHFRTEVRCPERLTLGDGTIVGDNAILDARRGLTMGRNVNLSSNEPTLKSKACLKCLYFTIIIFDLCRYLEYFSYLYTINQTE